MLSRLIVEIAQHELLGGELAFRGGTCLHKLHLPEPLRYSEDLDYVRRTHSGIKPYLTALRACPRPGPLRAWHRLRAARWSTSSSMPGHGAAGAHTAEDRDQHRRDQSYSPADQPPYAVTHVGGPARPT